MGLPVTVYRWDDAGAPQIANGLPSEIINVLKKCLVEGYGSKAGLGWTKPFEDAATFKVVFRNSTTDGSGGFVQFWAPNGTDTQSTGLRFKAAQSMSALDTWVNAQLQQQMGNHTSADYWVLIGTSTGFWFMTHNSLTSPYSSSIEKFSIFIGDIDAVAANDPGRFVNIMSGSAGDLTSSSWPNAFDYGMNPGSTIARIYDTDGSANSVIYNMDIRYSAGASNLSGVPTSDRVFIKLMLYSNTPLGNADRLGVNAGRSVVQPFYRGTIPGLLNTPQGGYLGQAWPVVETINGQQHMLMPGYNFGRNWINLETWYD